MPRLSVRLLSLAALSSAPLTAHAVEPFSIDGEAVHVDVTNASSVVYNVDNRDNRSNDVTSRANDHWGMWYNRLNLQGSWRGFVAGVRVDNAWFYHSPDPTQIALDMTLERGSPAGGLPPPLYFRQQVQSAGEELSNRYINWVYPAKYYVGYNTRVVETVVGDFYAQLGRGFVLSVRKMDEIASDTTVRGARVTGRIDAGSVRLRLTGLGGVMNPLRIDETSGRYLGVTSEVTPGLIGLTEAGMPRAVETDFVQARPTYAPDRILAGQIEIAPKGLKFGTQASYLSRQAPLNLDFVRKADQILTASQSLEVPDFGGVGSGYLEVAVQDLENKKLDGPQDDAELLEPGHAAYANVSIIAQPITLSVEGKHYRRFFPLRANVDLSRAREFSLVQYSAPPTAAAFWTDTEFEGFNTCVTGGRAKGDVELGKQEVVFAWVGRYHTWAESVSNDACDTSDANLNRVWDVASGIELTTRDRKSRANVTVGARLDETERTISDAYGETNVYYQEAYARYDVIRSLGGPYSLQMQGWHRRRRQSFGGADDPWLEGQHLTGVDWAPHLSVAFGVEYDTSPLTPDTYFNGQVVYKVTQSSSVSLFAGQRRGSLRCVGGVCRIFPPFEGARLDATVRF
ncbi:MAG: hypothetical protein KF718_08635 [Polyangiaceae bacterium]|nr:hypothetical protein [Polyangiaceae bacterium]